MFKTTNKYFANTTGGVFPLLRFSNLVLFIQLRNMPITIEIILRPWLGTRTPLHQQMAGGHYL